MHEEHEEINFSDATEVFGLESLLLQSVGITIGSSTSHLIFSRLTVRRHDSRTSRFDITEREVLHRSPITFTPYTEGVRVDMEKLRDFITRAYAEAGTTPDAVDTGAVIITGYAARKENAQAIVDLFSRWAGKFVCATAGPNLESIMAAHGSGAVARSKKTGKTVMNVDIGGGTTKIVIIRSGTIVETASLFVGSRVVAGDDEGRLARMEESGMRAAQELGIDLRMGAPLTAETKNAVAELLVNTLFEVLERKQLSPFARQLMETEPLHYGGEIDVITFSGGVAEYVYGHETSDFGDIGFCLGRKIRQRVTAPAFGMDFQEPEELIRATVMGASQYSLQVSGSTIFLSRSDVLPKRNLQVVKVCLEGPTPTKEQVAGSVRKALGRYDIDRLQPADTVALAVDLAPDAAIGPQLLRNLTEGLLAAWNSGSPEPRPLHLVFDIDIAHLVGSILAEKTNHCTDILCVDGIGVGDLDYIDIGTEIQSSRTVPVVVKNLVFSKGTAG